MKSHDISKVSLVIFDMDGLMLDTERLSLNAWTRAGKAYGYHIEPSVVIQAIGMNAKGSQVVYQTHYGNDFPLERIRALKSEYLNEQISLDGVPIKAGLYELLDFLEARQIRKAVATSTGRFHAEKLLSSAGIRDRFDDIICGDEVSEGKPDPEIFRTVASRFNVEPQACIVLEDSENGILGASRAQMIPIMVPDMKEPSPEIEALIHRKFCSLKECEIYLSDAL